MVCVVCVVCVWCVSSVLCMTVVCCCQCEILTVFADSATKHVVGNVFLNCSWNHGFIREIPMLPLISLQEMMS